jgi:isochorismate synthase
MISTQELPRTENTEEIESGKVADLVSSIDRNQIAFGLLFFPELGKFRFAACTKDELVRISNLTELWFLGNPSGFVAFPFDNHKEKGCFIPHRIPLEEIPDHFRNNDSEIGNKASVRLEATSAAHYKGSVQKAIDQIKEGRFGKLVVSRRSDQFFQPERLSSFLDSLIHQYPQANISIFNLPGEGLWVSVTPEVLLSFTPGEGIRSMALAGTKAYEPGFDEISLWSSKELDEQSIVTDFIRETFHDNGISKLKEKGPYSVQAGNLIHLRTDFFAVDAPLSDFFGLAGSLHPTTAVCGSPREEAFAWLSENEDFDRSYFSGFSGILDPDCRKLVVNLRAARITEGVISLFAGAGITKASVPEKEWEETGEKLKTIGNLL